jgi:hypothetical protein
MSFFSRIFGSRPDPKVIRRRQQAENRRMSAIVAANIQQGSAWIGMPDSEDSANQEYLKNLIAVLQRSQDMDVNNPDVRGFHRVRVAQVLGKGVRFMAALKPERIGMGDDACLGLCTEIDELRREHSRLGGFDSTGHRRSEGKQQERAFLTALVYGACLIHRVWRDDPDLPLPFSLELIPASRISTPLDKYGDPHISYGVHYEDDHRTRITGFHVRRVAKTIGNTFIPDFTWDFLPIEDCSLLELTESAGLDRSMPLSVAVVRMLRNRNEMIESNVEAARAQARHYVNIELAEGANQFEAAADDVNEQINKAIPIGLTKMGDSMQAIYSPHGEKVTNVASKLPEPDFVGFMDKTDERISRGFSASKSRFTRVVNSSWAGGRLEDQQDDPIIDQYRESFLIAWQQVNAWFIESIWLSDAVALEGYSRANRAAWTEFRATFPGKVHINPQDTQNARKTAFMNRSSTPQQACEEDGHELRHNLLQWADFYLMCEKIEKAKGIPAGSLAILFEGKSVSTSAGAEVGASAAENQAEPAPTNGRNGKKLNFGNRFIGVS